ncbi:MAG: T9SS type A sorting domain-containing protein, partial [Flavobacterium sp.]
VYAVRPFLTGTEVIYLSQYFDIHYTVTGTDYINGVDANSNGTPDYVDNMAAIFDNVWNQYALRGYGMPPSDGGLGGTNYYDIYIHNIGVTTYGYVSAEQTIGDNSSSTPTEVDAMTSWMGMNTTYSWVSGGITALDAIKVTAAHEFFHAVQFGICSTNTNFLSEATAAWAEDEIYPNIDDNLQYLGSIFNTPDVALNWNMDYDVNLGQQFSGHWYGAWIFFRYMTEHTSSSIIKDIWYSTIVNYEMGSIDIELQNWGTDFETEYQNFLVSCDVLSDSPAYAPYSFDKAPAYANSLTQHGIAYEAEWIYYGVDINLQVSNQANVGNSRLMRLSADYFNMTALLGFSLKLVPQYPSSSHMKFMLLKYDTIAGTMDVENSFMNGDTLQINIGNNNSYTNYTAIIYRDDYVMNNQNSGASEQYEVFVNYNAGSSGIENPNVTSSIQIYPNPSTDFIIFKSSEERKEFKIYNTLGKEVSRGITNVQTRISSLSKGLYYAKLSDENGVIFLKE